MQTTTLKCLISIWEKCYEINLVKKIVDSWICEFVKMPSPNYENKTLIETVLDNNNVSLRLLGTEAYVMKLSQMMH